MAQGRKPDFICIGAQKAGTTWLYVTLGRRPEIWFPPFKEFHFLIRSLMNIAVAEPPVMLNED